MVIPLLFRRASMPDATTLLKWRNDPLTVKYSITKRQVPYGDHMVWFEHSLTNPNREILLAYHDTMHPMGMIRFDKQDDGKLSVAIVVSPEHRGKGVGCNILRSIFKLRNDKKTYVAAIHNGNLASQKIFTANGFKLTTPNSPRHFSIYERHP